jgi:hypothetical protein
VSGRGSCTLANPGDAPATGRLIFRSGFETPSLVGARPQDAIGKTFVDEDTGYAWGIPWLDERGETYVSRTQTAGWGEDPHQIVEVIPDPDDPGNLLLHTANVSDTVPARSSQARVALRLFPDNANLATRQFYARYRIRLDPALAGVGTASSWSWFNVIEVKERQEPPFFFTGVDLVKEAGQPIVWQTKGRHRPPGAESFTTLWEVRNPRAPVPFGKWFTVEYYFRRDTSTGRILFAVTVDGGRSVVFDLDQTRPETIPAGFTTSEPTAASCPPLEAWEVMKTYVGPPRDVRAILGEPIDAWYDDLEIWSGLPDR